ncbi:MAG: sulfatase-like hydrolase/transferase [Bacteroidota bacterium]
MKYWPILFLCLLAWACTSPQAEQDAPLPPLVLDEQPNILWIVAEDMGPTIAAYGDSSIATPNLDRLAREGVRYNHCYSTHGVCAPSRAALATGMYPTAIAANHMRTYGNPNLLPPGIPPYEAIPPAALKMHSEQLRRAGYFTSNHTKEDYQFRAPRSAWDQSGREAHWRNRQPGQPFFSIFNYGVCHESGMWRNRDKELLVSPEKVIVPPYFPDNPTVRQEMARMYSNIALMDQQVGELLAELEADGLLEKTIIFFYADHGGPLPRQKREVYDSGLRVPLLIRFPNQQRAGTVSDELVSFIDFKPTLLSLANIPLPDYLHGQAFLGGQMAATPREYIWAARDRLDEETDGVRAVRDHQFKYVKNLHPELPNIMDVDYRKQMTLMQELYRLDSLGELSGPPARFFQPTKPDEELYDCQADPYEINNLAADPAYAKTLERLRAAYQAWAEAYPDWGAMPETDMIAKLWPDGQQPQTAAVVAQPQGDQLSLTSATEGASISYQLKTPEDTTESWFLYTEPIPMPQGKTVVAEAHRIGYLKSEWTTYAPPQ